jgi:hypothetical protein
VFGDVHVLDTVSWTWTKVTDMSLSNEDAETDALLNRTGHSSVVLGYDEERFVACFGGQDESGKRHNDFRVRKVGGNFVNFVAEEKGFQYEESMAY